MFFEWPYLIWNMWWTIHFRQKFWHFSLLKCSECERGKTLVRGLTTSRSNTNDWCFIFSALLSSYHHASSRDLYFCRNRWIWCYFRDKKHAENSILALNVFKSTSTLLKLFVWFFCWRDFNVYVERKYIFGLKSCSELCYCNRHSAGWWR